MVEMHFIVEGCRRDKGMSKLQNIEGPTLFKGWDSRAGIYTKENHFVAQTCARDKTVWGYEVLVGPALLNYGDLEEI